MYFRILTLATATLLLSVLSNAQAPSSRIGLVNSNGFGDEKTGITKYVNALKALKAEFTPLQTELTTMNARLKTLSTELDKLRGTAAATGAAAQAKVDEAEKLQRDIKFKADDATSRYSKREQVVLGPVLQSIGTGLQDFAKQKGYVLIFDPSRDQNGFLIAIGDQSADITKEFILFFNARP